MNPNISQAAAALAAPKLMRGFRLSWVLYGVAAYYGLKYMNKRGILPNQTGFALNMIDRGIGLAKDQFSSRFGIPSQGHSQTQQSSIAHH